MKTQPAILIMILVMVLAGTEVQAQEGALIGRVTDAELGIPVEAASVYLKHTLLGSASSEFGYYAIAKIPVGEYTLVVSRIGYEPYQQGVQIKRGTGEVEINVALKPEVYELGDVAVSAEQPKKWQKQYEQFAKLFLGTMPFEEEAEILNPYSLDFNDRRGRLSASSPEVLEIKNEALGYKIYFQLMGFSWRSRDQLLEFSGTGFFETDESESEAQLIEWKNNRSSPAGNYSWLARSNPSVDNEWRARIMRGRCKCNIYSYGDPKEAVCRCTYSGLASPSFLRRIE